MTNRQRPASNAQNIKESPFVTPISADEITIVVPTHNEEEGISLVIEDILIQGYENIMIVDGTSTDKTLKMVEKYKTKIVYRESGGKGSAIKTAIQKIKTPYFVLMDGDYTYRAKDIKNVSYLYNDNFEVIGVRSQGRDNITFFNRFGNWFITTLFNIINNTNITDVCSGLYLLPTKFMKSINLKATGFDIEVEIAANAALHGKIFETPIGYHPRKGTRKLNALRDGYIIVRRILLLGFHLKTSRMIYLIESALIFPGILFSLLSFNLNIFNRNLSSVTIGLILILLAIQGFTLLLVDSKLSKIKKMISNAYRVRLFR